MKLNYCLEKSFKNKLLFKLLRIKHSKKLLSYQTKVNQQAITCSKLTTEILEQVLKYVQS